MDRDRPDSPSRDARSDYDQLRVHVPRPPKAAPQVPAAQASETKVSVLDWLVTVGHAVARKLRTPPSSPMVRLYPKE